MTRVATVAELGDLNGKRVLVRSDLNVPLDGEVITDDGRIRASVATIRELAEAGARVVVIAHLGRPDGTRDLTYSLRPVATRLGELLESHVAFATDTVGPSAHSVVGGLSNGQVALLENVRFDPRETSKDETERAAFAEELAAFADAYVSDGFGAVHRKHASVYDLPARLPHAAGSLVLEEVEVLHRLTERPERAYVVVLGGAKVSDKLDVIDNLLGKADQLLIGGGMTYTFLAARGYEIGASLLEPDQVETCRGYLESAGDKIVLPTDVVAADAVAEGADHEVVAADAIPSKRVGVDIGPDSARHFGERIRGAGTVFWNGPMGVFEIGEFAEGTRAIAWALTRTSGLSVVGGGDSAAAVRALGFDEAAFGHISTGGGASLEYLEGRTLPGLTALEA